MNSKTTPIQKVAPVTNPRYGGKFDDELYYSNENESDRTDSGTANPEDVELSQQHGREHVEGESVPRPAPDYGWDGADDEDQEAKKAEINTQHKSVKKGERDY